ncbi:MAG: hypothetical protein AAGD22_16160 [Verrucomicrobiota bacterium]
MRLTIHRDTEPGAGESYLVELGKVFPLQDPQVTVTPRVNPEHRIFWASLVGSAEEWQGELRESVELYLTRCGDEGREAALMTDDSGKLREAAEALVAALGAMPEFANVAIGIPLPNNPHHAGMKLEGGMVDEVAWRLANFVKRAGKAHAFLSRAARDGRGPEGMGYLIPNEDGSLTLEWMERKSMKQREYLLV